MENDEAQSKNGCLPLIVGWLVGSLAAAIGVAIGHKYLNSTKDTIFALTFGLFVQSLLITWILLVVRGQFVEEVGLVSASLFGTIGGVVLLFPTHSLIAPPGVSDGRIELTAIYAASGAFAGAAWWAAEKLMRKPK